MRAPAGFLVTQSYTEEGTELHTCPPWRGVFFMTRGCCDERSIVLFCCFVVKENSNVSYATRARQLVITRRYTEKTPSYTESNCCKDLGGIGS